MVARCGHDVIGVSISSARCGKRTITPEARISQTLFEINESAQNLILSTDYENTYIKTYRIDIRIVVAVPEHPPFHYSNSNRYSKWRPQNSVLGECCCTYSV
jgi:hypothetical protein